VNPQQSARGSTDLAKELTYKGARDARNKNSALRHNALYSSGALCVWKVWAKAWQVGKQGRQEEAQFGLEKEQLLNPLHPTEKLPDANGRKSEL